MKLLYLVTVLAFAWTAPYTWGQVSVPDQVPKFISYQGFLTDSEGNKMTGPHNLTFSLYRLKNKGQGEVLWTETYEQLEINQGFFNLALGEKTPLDLPFGEPYFLEISVDGKSDFDRIRLTTSPYSFMAKSVVKNAIANSMIQDGAITADKLTGGHWVLGVDTTSTTTTVSYLGTQQESQDWILELRIKNQSVLRLHDSGASPNLIGGSSRNTFAQGVQGATIGGGGEKLGANDPTDTTRVNSVLGNFSTIGGGAGNRAGRNVAESPYATVSGGRINVASGPFSTLGGGEGNLATGSHSALSGGFSNKAFGDFSAIAGGRDNTVMGNYSFATGQEIVVVGDHSFAAGLKAMVGKSQGVSESHNGTFVWADSKNETFASTRSNQFLVRASGGVGIGTNDPEAAMHIQGDLKIKAQQIDGYGLTVINDTTGITKGILIQLGANPIGRTNDFLTFVDGKGDTVGRVEGVSIQDTTTGITTGGVVYESGAADFAEWLPRLDPEEKIHSGQIVGVYGGKITRKTKGADHLMAVSLAPAVLGNMPEQGQERRYEKVAFLGQVPVWVKGPVQKGDYILPSGLEDGHGIAVSPHLMQPKDFFHIVGRAWETRDNPLPKRVQTAVGLPSNDWMKIFDTQTAQITDLEKQNAILQTQISSLKQQQADQHLRLAALESWIQSLGKAVGPHPVFGHLDGNPKTSLSRSGRGTEEVYTRR